MTESNNLVGTSCVNIAVEVDPSLYTKSRDVDSANGWYGAIVAVL